MNKVLAVLTAAAIIFLAALVALDEEKVTGLVGTVDVRICRLSALMAVRNNFFGDPLP